MLAETVTIPGYNGDYIHAYFSRPLGKAPHPSIVLIPHMPGWDEMCRETARRFTQHGYAVVCPDIFCRFGHGAPEEIAAKAREAGGASDESVMGDCEGALKYLASRQDSNGRAGVIGMCSGGRHAFLAGCRIDGFHAAVDCWGGRVVATGDGARPGQPVAPIELTSQLKCPLLGIFGNDDKSPTPEQVDIHEAELKKYGKEYAFHRYDGAGHAFWSYGGEAYRPKQAMDSWARVFEFFSRHLMTNG